MQEQFNPTASPDQDAVANPSKDKLYKEFYIGTLMPDGSRIKDYRLQRVNGVVEKVFADKSPQRPYTWMADVLSVCIDAIGGKNICSVARQEYVKTGGSITTPKEILNLPIGDASSCLVEIHRTVWKNLIRKQEVMCKYCGKPMVMDIDLDRIEMLEEDKHKLELPWEDIVVTLPYGYTYNAPEVAGGRGKEKINSEFDGQIFNKFIFRLPVLGDAIRHEKYYDDSVVFWRRIAFDCLEKVLSVDGGGNMISELPTTAWKFFGLRLFDLYMDGEDLDAIRVALRESPPALPFYYKDICANALCRMETPVAIEQGSFFSV